MGHTIHLNGEKVRFALRAARANADMREVFLYLLIPPDTRTWAGTRRFFPEEPLPYMPDLTVERIQAALDALKAAGLVDYDPEAQLIFTPLVLEMQAYVGHKSVAGAAGGIKDFPDSPLLIPILEHLASAEEEAATEAREKAEAMREGEKKEKALAAVAKMDELAQELRARRAKIAKTGSPIDGASKGHRWGIDGASKDHRRGIDGASSEGGAGEELPEIEAIVPENAPQAKTGSPIEGASMGLPVSGPSPLPLPSPEDPSQKGFPKPVEGRCREGPPESLGEVLDKIRGQEGSG